MDMATQVQILDKAACISHRSYTPGEDMNLTILLQEGYTGLFN